MRKYKTWRGYNLRDSQREKSYRAERYLRGYSPHYPECFSSYKSVREFVTEVVAGEIFNSYNMGINHPIEIIKCRAGAKGGYRGIYLSGGWTWNKIVILHELAHTGIVRKDSLLPAHLQANIAPHGKEWAGLFLELVYKHVGFNCGFDLESAMVRFGVKFTINR